MIDIDFLNSDQDKKTKDEIIKSAKGMFHNFSGFLSEFRQLSDDRGAQIDLEDSFLKNMIKKMVQTSGKEGKPDEYFSGNTDEAKASRRALMHYLKGYAAHKLENMKLENRNLLSKASDFAPLPPITHALEGDGIKFSNAGIKDFRVDFGQEKEFRNPSKEVELSELKSKQEKKEEKPFKVINITTDGKALDGEIIKKLNDPKFLENAKKYTDMIDNMMANPEFKKAIGSSYTKEQQKLMIAILLLCLFTAVGFAGAAVAGVGFGGIASAVVVGPLILSKSVMISLGVVGLAISVVGLGGMGLTGFDKFGIPGINIKGYSREQSEKLQTTAAEAKLELLAGALADDAIKDNKKAKLREELLNIDMISKSMTQTFTSKTKANAALLSICNGRDIVNAIVNLAKEEHQGDNAKAIKAIVAEAEKVSGQTASKDDKKQLTNILTSAVRLEGVYGKTTDQKVEKSKEKKESKQL